MCSTLSLSLHPCGKVTELHTYSGFIDLLLRQTWYIRGMFSVTDDEGLQIPVYV
jgi:hypothetical protein